jgi:hypothetical protein
MPEQTTTTADTYAENVSMYVKATLKDGTIIISPFTQLNGLEGYAANVMSGRKPFNAWQIVSTTHPVSGERGVLQRRRRLVSGDQITELEEVKPLAGTDPSALNPDDFEPVIHVKRGEGGFHKFQPGTEEQPLPEHAAAGVEYPIHREADGYGYVRYVILKVEAEGQPEVRFYLDARRADPETSGPVLHTGDADEDVRSDEFGGEHDDF